PRGAATAVSCAVESQARPDPVRHAAQACHSGCPSATGDATVQVDILRHRGQRHDGDSMTGEDPIPNAYSPFWTPVASWRRGLFLRYRLAMPTARYPAATSILTGDCGWPSGPPRR